VNIQIRNLELSVFYGAVGYTISALVQYRLQVIKNFIL